MDDKAKIVTDLVWSMCREIVLYVDIFVSNWNGEQLKSNLIQAKEDIERIIDLL